ncbi:hypothetical protein LC608_32150 [Nostoc sp. XA010]|uniref:hypothetical protein n=1 Tax=Nostoc sp. XA010 TaxID=2780407 RepID=UPI001E3DAE66|nr:hypothetical protein [Nostoc sp. XA010]MCC5661521.1 hypothetical protein [Nostoc sp. XA010]
MNSFNVKSENYGIVSEIRLFEDVEYLVSIKLAPVMKSPKTALFIVISLFVSGLLTWIGRGEYDKDFMMNGYFHVVSNANQDHEVVLGFPSQKLQKFSLKKGGSFDFKLDDTGEGSISVSIDGKVRDKIGYVTSMNNTVVLVVGDERTEFSQIFPSLVSEQGTTVNAPKPRQ